MELRDWGIHFPVLADYDNCHKDLGALSDFFARSKPGDVLEFKSVCQAEGKIYGNPSHKDGEEVRTSRVLSIRRVRRMSSNCEYAIVTEDGKINVKYENIDKKFLSSAIACGTPGVYPD